MHRRADCYARIGGRTFGLELLKTGMIFLHYMAPYSVECLDIIHPKFYTPISDCFLTPPRFRRDYPLNLSISVSGGKESNSDSRSSGERNGNSSAHNLPGYQACGEMLRQGNGR